MDNIIEPTVDFDFSNLYLGQPSSLSGGAYFTRIFFGSKPIYIQTPKSLTKQGFVKNGKKIYTDLMFDNNDTIFINWIERLETKCQELIYSNGDNWFQTKLEKDDIESAFTSPFKIYKSGKFYLLRANVKPNIKIYGENDEMMNFEDVNVEQNMISILEIQGIKFTSRNFQIEIELKQSMAVSPDPFLDACFIKKPNVKLSPVIKNSVLEDSVLEDSLSSNVKENSDNLSVSLLPTTNTINTNTNNNSEPIINLEEFIKESAKEINLNSAENNVKNSTPLVESLESIKSNDNVILEVEDLIPKSPIIEDPYTLTEVNLASHLENDLETITLKKPNQVYYEIYKKAREKAKAAKKDAILAYLELKNIKKTYMLEDIDESDSDSELDNIDKSQDSDNDLEKDV